MEKEEKDRFYGSMVFPGLLVILLWIIKIIEVSFGISFAELGLLPQSVKGLRGIIFSPLLHADWKHLSANSVPLFILTAGLIYYYRTKARTIFILCWLVTGLWVWFFAKDTGIHIGASGVVYALATFHFTSGLLRREPRVMAFSLFVVFLYGGLVWGVIPDFFPEKNISWESHLLGGLAGIVIAIAYRKEGPQRKIYQWDEDEPETDDTEDEFVQSDAVGKENSNEPEQKDDTEEQAGPVKINYHYTEKKQTP